MKNVIKNIIGLKPFKLLIILAVFYFSQVYPYYHFHHSHSEGVLNTDLTAQQFDFNTEHPHDHDHDHGHSNDSDTEHNEDHQHTYDKHVDLHVVRTQNQNSSVDDSFVSISQASFKVLFEESNQIIQTTSPPYIEYQFYKSITVRGPPSFC